MNNAVIDCIVCGKEFRLAGRRKGAKFCDAKCYWENMKGKKTWNKGTKGIMKPNKTSFKKGHVPKHAKPNYINSLGYIMTKSPKHPRKTSRGYVMEHRLIMEKTIGRYLEAHEIIHHINEIRNDNRPENLKLLQSNKEHRKIHKLIKN